MADKKAPTRDEVVSKIQELDEAITQSKSEAASKAKIAIGIGVVALAAIAFASGRRRALRPKTIVSFSKIR